jgi:hypothetical protein
VVEGEPELGGMEVHAVGHRVIEPRVPRHRRQQPGGRPEAGAAGALSSKVSGGWPGGAGGTSVNGELLQPRYRTGSPLNVLSYVGCDVGPLKTSISSTL